MVGFDNGKHQNASNTDFLVAGCVSGFFGRAFVQPLDVVKVRFQLQVEPITTLQTSAKYRSFFQAIRCIAREEGFGAFWKGHMSSQLLAFSFSGVQFTSFELYTRWWAKKFPVFYPNTEMHRPAALAVHFGCGSLAGVTAAVFTQPLDVLKTRFIAQGEPRIYRNMNEAVVCIAKREGIRGFFRGMSPSIILMAPQTGLGFATYKFVLSVIGLCEAHIIGHSPSDDGSVRLTHSACAGVVAGFVSKILVYPMDVAKKRLQVQGFEEARTTFGRPLVVGGLRDCIMKTWKNEGLYGLFKGLQPSIFKACLSTGVVFPVYESVLNLLLHKNIFNRSSDKPKE